MKICVPTENDTGLEAAVSGHFGRAPYFAFVDSESRKVDFVANLDAGHLRGRCRGAALAADGHPEAVLASGMGHGAFDLLRSGGARIYLTSHARLVDAVDGYLHGKAAEMTEGEAIGHHHAGRSAEHHRTGAGHGGGCCGGHREDRR